ARGQADIGAAGRRDLLGLQLLGLAGDGGLHGLDGVLGRADDRVGGSVGADHGDGLGQGGRIGAQAHAGLEDVAVPLVGGGGGGGHLGGEVRLVFQRRLGGVETLLEVGAMLVDALDIVFVLRQQVAAIAVF